MRSARSIRVLRAPSINAQILSVVQNEPAMGGKRRGLATSADVRCLPFWLFGPANVWSYPTFPPPIQSELFDTDSESDPAQRQQMPGAFKPPPPPKAPVRYTWVQDPGEASLGSLLVCVGRTHPIPNVCRVRISPLSAVDVSDGSFASFERCRHVCFTPNYGRITATQRTDALGQRETLRTARRAPTRVFCPKAAVGYAQLSPHQAPGVVPV